MRSPKAGTNRGLKLVLRVELTRLLGRGWESFGPDPWLSGEAAFETITGVQSIGVVRHLVTLNVTLGEIFCRWLRLNISLPIIKSTGDTACPPISTTELCTRYICGPSSEVLR